MSRSPNTAPPSCGQLHRPLESPMLDDPRPLYARARAEEPIFWSDSLAMWVVTRYDDVKAVARDAARFSSLDSISPVTVTPPPQLLEVLMQGFAMLPSLVDSDPPIHTRTRAMVSRALSLRRIGGFEPALRTLANDLIDRFIDDGRVEFVSAFAIPLPGSFIIDLLGLPREDLQRVNAWTDHTSSVFAGRGTLAELIVHARELVAFQHYLAAAIEDRRANPRHDALTDIVRGAAEEPPLGMAEQINILLQVVFAGYETTAGMLTRAAVELARDPELFAALRTDPKTIGPRIIEETLRVASPIHSMYRTATEDVELGGVRIRKGERLQLAYISANHDAERFDDPLSFQVGRSTAHLAFGQGSHFCIGAPLARLEGLIAMEIIAERFATLHLVPGQELEYFASATARRLEAVELEW